MQVEYYITLLKKVAMNWKRCALTLGRCRLVGKDCAAAITEDLACGDTAQHVLTTRLS